MTPQPGSAPGPEDMDLSDERVRRRMLAEGPVGAWATLPGTHTMLVYELIRFSPDGRGECSRGGGVTDEIVERFTWSPVGSGLLACTIVDSPLAVDDDGCPDPIGPAQVPFRFEQRSTDVGTYWVMCDPEGDGFWDLVLPVAPRLRPPTTRC